MDRLPPRYRDMSEFRRVFSAVAKPPYCQIAMRSGVIQQWGLVEFGSANEAEETLERTDGAELGCDTGGDGSGCRIRVQFCTPGVRAISIYMDFVNDPMEAVNSREKRALLEEAPSTKVGLWALTELIWEFSFLWFFMPFL